MIKNTFSKFITEPLSRDLCLKINAFIGTLLLFSSILGLIVNKLKNTPYDSWTAFGAPIIGFFFISGWLLRNQFKGKLDAILLAQGLILLTGLCYAPIKIMGWVDWWQHTSGFKRVSLSPGIMTLLSIFTFRLVGDFGLKRYSRKIITLSALLYGIFLEILMIVQFIRIQNLG